MHAFLIRIFQDVHLLSRAKVGVFFFPFHIGNKRKAKIATFQGKIILKNPNEASCVNIKRPQKYPIRDILRPLRFYYLFYCSQIHLNKHSIYPPWFHILLSIIISYFLYQINENGFFCIKIQPTISCRLYFLFYCTYFVITTCCVSGSHSTFAPSSSEINLIGVYVLLFSINAGLSSLTFSPFTTAYSSPI